MNSAEATVRHHGDDITGPQFRHEASDDLVGIGHRKSAFALCYKRCDQLVDRKLFARRNPAGFEKTCDDNNVGRRERLAVLRLKDLLSGSPGARFIDRNDASSRIALRCCGKRFPDRGRMVGEIVDDCNPIDDAAHFHPALHTLERRKGFRDSLTAYAERLGRCDGAETIAHAKQAGERSPKAPEFPAFTEDSEARFLLPEIDLTRGPMRIVAVGRKPLYRTPHALRRNRMLYDLTHNRRVPSSE